MGLRISQNLKVKAQFVVLRRFGSFGVSPHLELLNSVVVVTPTKVLGIQDRQLIRSGRLYDFFHFSRGKLPGVGGGFDTNGEAIST